MKKGQIKVRYRLKRKVSQNERLWRIEKAFDVLFEKILRNREEKCSLSKKQVEIVKFTKNPYL